MEYIEHMSFGRRSAELTTREEAKASDLPVYGEVSEIYEQLPDGASGELIGTRIAMIHAGSGHAVMSTTIELAYSRSQKAYERGVRRAIAREAKAINAYNRILTGPTSS